MILLLGEEPLNGYQMMQRLEQRSGGAWRVSSGAMYPALAQLEDQGLIETVEADGKRLYTLTDDGQHYREQLVAQLRPWDAAAQNEQDTGVAALRQATAEIHMIAHAIGKMRDPEYSKRAAQQLDAVKAQLAQLLAKVTAQHAPHFDADHSGEDASAE
ncbi:MAG: PadR family transcriptional regulator [Actinomycetaceae bacterium]|nr:PadR family transcriptional regulator [Actinomycetaceae bacterium]MDY6082638.1 PadR family transcriptional regulator [Actinomycetaceae bacterium]